MKRPVAGKTESEVGGTSPGIQDASTSDTIKNLMAANYALYNLVSSGFQQSPGIREIGVELNLIESNEVFQGVTQYNDYVINTSVLRLMDLDHEYDLLILVIPSRGLWQGDNQQSVSKIHDRFVELLAHKKLDHVDLRSAMEETGDPLSHHFSLEGHWNEKGHALAAKELSRHLESTGKFSTN